MELVFDRVAATSESFNFVAYRHRLVANPCDCAPLAFTCWSFSYLVGDNSFGLGEWGVGDGGCSGVIGDGGTSIAL